MFYLEKKLIVFIFFAGKIRITYIIQKQKDFHFLKKQLPFFSKIQFSPTQKNLPWLRLDEIF